MNSILGHFIYNKNNIYAVTPVMQASYCVMAEKDSEKWRLNFQDKNQELKISTNIATF